MMILVLVVVWLLWTSPAFGQNRVVLDGGHIGCVWEVQNKAREYVLAKDMEAAKLLWLRESLLGKCDGFYQGEEVIVLERSAWYGMSRIKRPGDTMDYWVFGILGR